MQFENIRWLDDKNLSLEGKRLLCRLDVDIPVNQTGRPGNLTRLLNVTQTLSYALQQGAQVVAVGHLGNPKGKFRKHLSLYPIADYLQQRLQCDVMFVHDGVGDGAHHLASRLKKGEMLMLENLLFDRGEQANHAAFAQKLAQLAHIYVNDAFACCPSEYASVASAAHLFACRVGGLALRKQLDTLRMLQHNPPRPVVAVLGGEQHDVDHTLPLLQNLLPHVDEFLLCGYMAHAFLSTGVTAAPTIQLSASSKQRALVTRLWNSCQQRSIPVTLPQDVMAHSPKADKPVCVQVDPQATTHPSPLDIGPQTCELFTNKLKQAGTALLLDCVGQWQQPQYNKGMTAVLSSMAQGPQLCIIAGNDALQAHYEHAHRSTTPFQLLHSSQAALAALGYDALPGLQALITQDRT
ncbi:MAG: phosphoglycerate kinase [Myxococcota bacterium]